MFNLSAISAQWWIFGSLLTALLLFDFFLLWRPKAGSSMRLSLLMLAANVLGAALFAFWLLRSEGPAKAVEFVAGFCLEEALSVDNLFVFYLLFAHFRIPESLQHRVLQWGILSAFVLRGLFIAAGSALVSQFDWVLRVFGVLLFFAGGKLLLSYRSGAADESPSAGGSAVQSFFERVLPYTGELRGKAFLVREGGVLKATPLLLVLCLVEVSDIIFAVDSIPAIFAVTQDPVVVYTSNIFAILSLRSLYFVLGQLLRELYYLKLSLGIILCGIALKLFIGDHHFISPLASLAFIVVVFATGVALSLARKGPKASKHSSP